MKISRFSLLAVVAITTICAFAQDTRNLSPQYGMRGNRLLPKSGVGFSIDVAKDFRYVGGQRFILKQVADAEQHVFVQAAPDGVVQRMVWIQFESFLPSNSHRYNYQLPDRLKLGDLEFVSDAMVYRSYESDDPVSDHFAIQKLLAAHKLRFAGPMARRRLFHLPDPDRRRELMIIYVEAVKLDPKNIPEDGASDEQWPEIARSLRQGAQNAVIPRPHASR